MKPAALKQVEGAVVGAELIAEAVIDIAEGMKRLRSGRLTDRAIEVLVKEASPGGVTMTQVRNVLTGLERLQREFVKPEKK